MIFCVEDDSSIRELVVYTLRSTGFEAQGFSDAKSLFDELKDNLPELLLLDIMLPGDDGFSVLKKLRSAPATKKLPVIMVTAKNGEYDKVTALDGGADDYITKPFGMMELVSRIRAVLRRTAPAVSRDELHVGQILMDTGRHIVTAAGREVELTLKEFELLRTLMENEGIVLTRDRLLENVWGYGFESETRTVDVHIRTLRQKLGDCGSAIETVRGVGYRIGGAG